MKRIGSPAAWVIGLLSWASVYSATASPIAYVASESKAFGVIDLATGVFTGRGSTPDVLLGLGIKNGVLYAVDTNSQLLTVDPATGATTVVGPTGIPGVGPIPENGSVSYLTSLGTGALYAFDFSNNLYSIDAASGAATLIGPTGIPQLTTPRSSFAAGADASSLYYMVESVDDNLNTLVPGSLYRVNPLNGASTLITSALPALPFPGAVFADGSFYAFRASLGSLPPPEIWRINPTTGAVISIIPQDPSLGVMTAGIVAPVPEPSSLTLAVMGAAALLVLRQLWKIANRS